MNPITKLTIDLSKPNCDAKQKLDLVCRTVKTAVPNADRVSLCLFDENKQAIYCLMCVDENGESSHGMELKRESFTDYFDFVLENKVLSASEARDDRRTKCFNEAYFEPLNIFSLLDYTFHIDMEPVGVICCEHVGEVVSWTEDDANSLTRISGVTSMFFSEQITAQGDKASILNYIY